MTTVVAPAPSGWVLADPTPWDLTPVGADRPDAVCAGLRELHERTVAYFEVAGRLASSSGAAEAEVVARAISLGASTGCPVVGVIRSVAVDPGPDGIAALAAWGKVAVAAVRASGVVPILLAVTGPVHGSLTPLLGLADHLVLTRDATTYVSGPGPVKAVTGIDVDPVMLGGAAVHAGVSGLAALIAEDPDDAVDALSDLLDHLPDNNLGEPPSQRGPDPVERRCERAAAIVPGEASRAYDVREVLSDVVDADSLLEIHAEHAPALITAYARIGGRSVAVIANQPGVRAGTLDLEASVKGARHVQRADSFGLPIVTFVDTPGYQPGKDLEARGMIRHGASLVHAYAEATVPRLCVILRKAYGGAYIVMDSRTMGSDLVLAWPGAEIAVMGPAGAVEILHRGQTDPLRRAELEADYRETFCTPRLAAERGLVDGVIDPADTRRALAAAVKRLRTKRPPAVHRKHSNPPL